MTATSQRRMLLVLLSLLSFLAASALINISPPSAAAAPSKADKRFAHKVINVSAASNKRLARLRLTSERIAELEQQGVCLERMAISIEERLSGEVLFVFAFSALGALYGQGIYDLVVDNPEFIGKQQRFLQQRGQRLRKIGSNKRQRIMAAGLLAHSRQIPQMQQIAPWVDFDLCRLEQLVDENDGYSSDQRFIDLLIEWSNSAVANIPPEITKNLETQGARQERISDRALRMLEKTLPGKRRRTKLFATPAEGLFRALENDPGTGAEARVFAPRSLRPMSTSSRSSALELPAALKLLAPAIR